LARLLNGTVLLLKYVVDSWIRTVAYAGSQSSLLLQGPLAEVEHRAAVVVAMMTRTMTCLRLEILQTGLLSWGRCVLAGSEKVLVQVDLFRNSPRNLRPGCEQMIRQAI
jgi:hypothetical protein